MLIMWMHFFPFFFPTQMQSPTQGAHFLQPRVQLSVINNTAALGQFTNKVTIDHQLAKQWPAPQRLQAEGYLAGGQHIFPFCFI